MSFYKLQERLKQEGWYVGWNHYCCPTCAWDDVPDNADLSKVLFNHSQDCQVDICDDEHKCAICNGEGYDTDGNECEVCESRGYTLSPEEAQQYLVEGSFICHTPEQQNSSMFCFDGSKEGVQNLIDILPLIEECDCSYKWDKTGNHRIYISWDNNR